MQATQPQALKGLRRNDHSQGSVHGVDEGGEAEGLKDDDADRPVGHEHQELAYNPRSRRARAATELRRYLPGGPASLSLP